ncbi:MAG: hypothetical protein BGP03_07125 [Pseudonocardia sp. 73-21]|nr:MAG: hypothetical protein BGP03_07125 [Pseudonocardia sp. 73-21]
MGQGDWEDRAGAPVTAARGSQLVVVGRLIPAGRILVVLAVAALEVADGHDRGRPPPELRGQRASP